MELAGLEALAASLGGQAYRGRQLYEWLYRRAALSLEEMSSLPLEFRRGLAGEGYAVGMPEIARAFPSRDGSVKFLLRLRDGEEIEAVLMPDVRHDTLCISSQAGCAMGCTFCATATMGLRRHLTAGEIAGQVLAIRREKNLVSRRLNVLFMGMGEPLHNGEAVFPALRLMTDPLGMGIAPRRVTISTVGLVPAIERLAAEERRPRLAVSITAARDELRDSLMPVNRRYPLEALAAALESYPRRTREVVTLEYVLMRGVNDSPQDAAALCRLARRVRAKVNLIAYNEVPGLPYARPRDEETLAFQSMVREGGLPVFIRRPRGRDVAGACGQLRLERGEAGRARFS